jgi:hypothetical protein
VSLATWHEPAFMAAFIFSYARFERRGELMERNAGAELQFLRNGCYLCRRSR